MRVTKKLPATKPTHKPKRIGTRPKIPFQLLGLPDPTEEQKFISMDEVRRQVLLMSSRGFGEAVRSDTPTPSAKGRGRNEDPKPRRGASE